MREEGNLKDRGPESVVINDFYAKTGTLIGGELLPTQLAAFSPSNGQHMPTACFVHRVDAKYLYKDETPPSFLYTVVIYCCEDNKSKAHQEYL
jgi:hypothetical protein